MRATLPLILLAAAAVSATEPKRQPETYFRERAGLTAKEIETIAGGKAVAKVVDTGDKSEVAVFGAVYVDAPVETYLAHVRDLDKLARTPGYLGVHRISDPAAAGDFEGFSFEPEDIEDLRKCSVDDCDVQLPAAAIADLHKLIAEAGTGAAAAVDGRTRELLREGISRYRAGGIAALGEYRDKKRPTRISEQFATLLGRSRALPEYLPAFHRYLLDYPDAKLDPVEDELYWEKVDFGLKPTLRLNHLSVHRVPGEGPVAAAVGIKQIYASHYFETAVDLSFCVKDLADAKRSGFYLITLKGSRQDGLTGLKGSITRHVVVGKTQEAMVKALDYLRAALVDGAAAR